MFSQKSSFLVIFKDFGGFLGHSSMILRVLTEQSRQASANRQPHGARPTLFYGMDFIQLVHFTP